MPLATEISRLSILSSRLFKNWGTTMAVYGGVSIATFLYLTDWKVTNQNIPFYGRKFDDDGNL